ncbi:hypothetical protein RZS08_48825, partial [Arthrospira platensis SPKY1]|nr:hypothetical protein [Arthrospira platensis SPKY1]
RKPIENIRQEWSGLRKVREELQKDYKDWKKLEQKATQVFEQLKAEMAWDVALHIQDKMPEAREIRFTLHHVFPLGDELVGYNNSATLVFEQRLSGQIFVWHLFPQ